MKVTEVERKSDRAIRGVQGGVCILLCALSAGLGTLTFLLLRNAELETFKATFISATELVSTKVESSIFRKIETSHLVNQIFGNELQGPHIGTLPNFTLKNFEATMVTLCRIAEFRSISFSPLVNQTTRSGWEAYARNNVGLLNGPASLTISTNGSWTVGDGIYNITTTGKRTRDTGYISSSPYSYSLFPVWQIAPIASNSALVMLDSHAVTFEGRSQAIDEVIRDKKPASSGLVHLIQDDAGPYRPSTVIWGPIQSLGNGTPIVGLFSGAFSWDDALTGILKSNYGRVYCVIFSASNSVTFALENAQVTYIGQGDLHDTRYDNYVQTLRSTNINYTLRYYPSSDLYFSYITDSPRNICIIVVSTIAFTAAVVFFYSYLVQERNTKMTEKMKHSYAETASRDAVLKSRKMYVRYMSHEMRTPLNVVSIGLKIVEKDLMTTRLPFYKDRVATVRDIMRACDLTVVFLNDLLNFGKLEEGLLKLKLRRTQAIPFISAALHFFSFQAEEKNVTFVLDLKDKPETLEQPAESVSVRFVTVKETPQLTASDPEPKLELRADDFIMVDDQKMTQVVRNIVSNAVKYSYSGGTVVVKVRKVPPRNITGTKSPEVRTPQRISPTSSRARLRCTNPFRSLLATNSHCSSPCSPASLADESNLESGITSPAYSEKNASANIRVVNDTSDHVSEELFDTGKLILEVMDSGPGMTEEECEKLFCDTTQFDPTELKPGSGSGLGSVIAKALVQLHGGQVSISSRGRGQGCVVTLTLPLSSLRDVVPLVKNRSSEQSCAEQLVSKVSSNSVPLSSSDIPCTLIPTSHNEYSGPLEYNNVKPFQCVRRQLDLLVVDDSALNRRMLIKLLCADHHRCDQAEDGLQAVKKYKDRLKASLLWDSMKCGDTESSTRSVSVTYTNLAEIGVTDPWISPQDLVGPVVSPQPMYDAILMDFMMPNMDGPTATKAIRELGYTGLILGITGNALTNDIDFFLMHGADQVLVKPVNPEALEEALSTTYSVR